MEDTYISNVYNLKGEHISEDDITSLKKLLFKTSVYFGYRDDSMKKDEPSELMFITTLAEAMISKTISELPIVDIQMGYVKENKYDVDITERQTSDEEREMVVSVLLNPQISKAKYIELITQGIREIQDEINCRTN